MLTLFGRGRKIGAASTAAMKTRITLSIDSDLLREVNSVAAKRGKPVNALLAEKLRELVNDGKAYERAKRRALARLRKGFDLGYERPSSRDELHKR